MKKWPEVTYGDIFNYFVLSEGVDGAAMKNFKSTEAYQYLLRESGLCNVTQWFRIFKSKCAPQPVEQSKPLGVGAN